MTSIQLTTPEQCFQGAAALLDTIIERQDDEDFKAVEATLLTNAAIAYSLQGLLAAKILDQRP